MTILGKMMAIFVLVLSVLQFGLTVMLFVSRSQWAAQNTQLVARVGTANASYSHPLVIEKSLLVVLVSHAVVRNELFMHKEAILEKLRPLPGCGGVKGLALRSS